jgi:hypothetical protein
MYKALLSLSGNRGGRASEVPLHGTLSSCPENLGEVRSENIGSVIHEAFTYDHRLKRIGHPVRSAIHKLEIGGLVVRWVTTGEYPLLYVIFLAAFYFGLFFISM